MSRLSRKSAKVELLNVACYVGVDVHKSSYYVSILSEDGLHQEFSTPAEPASFLTSLQSRGLTVLGLAYESGPTGYELAWACQSAGIPLTVAAPSKIPRPISAGGKTDRLDAIKLAEYLSRGMLKSVTVPTREEHALRELERRRQQLVYGRTKLKQQFKSFLLKNSIPNNLRSWSNAEIEALKAMQIGDVFLQATLESYLCQLEFLDSQLAVLRKCLMSEMIRMGKGELIRHLQTIPGVGTTVSHTFVAEIFRPERFERAEEICAYVGLAPIISQSGQSNGVAYTRKVGQVYLKSILVEAAWVAIRRDEYFRRVYNRLVNRHNITQKAIVAVARKLLTVMWRVAVENRPYRSLSI